MLTKNQPLLITMLVLVILYRGSTAIVFTSKDTVETLYSRPDLSVGQGVNSTPTSDQAELDQLCCEASGSKCTSRGVVVDESKLVNAIFCRQDFVLIPESGGYKKISYIFLKTHIAL